MIEIESFSTLPEKIFFKPGKGVAAAPGFVRNEVVKGRVLKTSPAQDVWLLIKGKVLTAKTGLALSEGDVLFFRVEQAAPVPVLKLLAAQPSTWEAVNLSTLLSAVKDNPWKSVFERLSADARSSAAGSGLREIMNDLTRGVFLEPPQNLLEILIEKSGLNWEKKLRQLCTAKDHRGSAFKMLMAEDLKGLGSKLLSGVPDPENLMLRFVDTIKNFQLFNHLVLQPDGKIFLPVPLQLPGGLFTVAQLLIHLGWRSGGEGSMDRKDRPFHRLSFVLELSNLGPLRADLTVISKEIEGRFLLSDETARQLLQNSLPVLVRSLEARGFIIRHVGCFLEKPEDVARSLIRELIQEESCSISLVA